MKIVCDKCATKYSIADDKVRGKVFKIRCKKCSHIIVVKGTEGAGAGEGESQAEADDGATIAAGMESPSGVSASAEKASAEKVWYLVVSGEQIGPLSAAEVGSKFSSGDIDTETYGWREGMGDWLRVGSIEELSATVGKNGANGAHANGGETRRTDLSDMFSGQQAAAPADEGGDDLFGAARGASEGARGASPMHAGTAAEAGHDAKLTGQRNENSVLFSLSNLQAMATAAAPARTSAPAPESRAGYATAKNEGSGLIDIRAMAAATLSAVSSSSSSSDAIGDLPSFSAAPVFAPVVQPPVMLPTQQSGTPKWIWGVVGGGVVALLAMGGVVIFALGRKSEVQSAPVVAMAQPAGAPSGTSPSTPAPAPVVAGGAAAAAGTADRAPANAAPVAAAVVKAPEKEPVAVSSHAAAKHEHGAKTKGGSAPSGAVAVASTPTPAKAAPAPKEEPKPVAKASGKKKDDLDSLLDEAVAPGAAPSKKSAPKAAPAADDSNLPEQLDRPSVMAGMKAARVQACFDQYKVPGTAIVAIVIGKAGRVKSANVGGALAGTPTGDCVARAVKGVGFKPFKGADMSISYPFILR